MKTLTSSNDHRVQYFLLKFCTRFLLSNVYKRVCGIFLFCLYLECKKRVCRNQVCKSVKNECLETRSFLIFANNSRSKQIKKKKSHTPFCRHWYVGNVCKVSAKNIELKGSSSSSKFSNFHKKYLVSRKQ